VKGEILSYRQAGTMPDLVSIGNEVDTGFSGTRQPTGADFGGFAALQSRLSGSERCGGGHLVGPRFRPR